MVRCPEGWTTTGSGFFGTSNAASLSFAGDVFSTPGSVSTRTGGINQVGTLRSHSFESDTPRIFIRARTKDIVARVVIDNYHMAMYQPLLYGGTVKRNNEVDSRGQFQWIRLDGNLDKYTGETWWLEIIDSGTGFAEISEVRISAEASPPTETHPVLDLSLGSDADIETAEDFARELDRAWSESLAAVRDGSATGSHTSFLNCATPTLSSRTTNSPETCLPSLPKVARLPNPSPSLNSPSPWFRDPAGRPGLHSRRPWQSRRNRAQSVSGSSRFGRG